MITTGFRRVRAIVAVALMLAVTASAACDGAAVNRWRVAHRLGPLPSAEADRLAAALTPYEAEFNRRASYTSSVAAVDATGLGASWRPGCPVAPADLRRVTVSYWGFDDRGHSGTIVVHRSVAAAVADVFRDLWNARYPVERVEPTSSYGGDDEAAMRADATSGFNCRPVAGTTRWSEHARGMAIDLNPLRNPWVRADGSIDPPEGRPWAVRTSTATGVIHAGDAAVDAFARHGWRWGGTWSGSKDYQHFSVSGR